MMYTVCHQWKRDITVEGHALCEFDIKKQQGG